MRLGKMQGYLAVLVILAVIAAGLVAFNPAAPAAAAEEETGSERVISVVGEAQLQATPDIAEIRLGVRSEAPTAAEAMEANSAAMTRVIEALKDAGVAARDIQTERLYVQQYKDPLRVLPNGERTGEGEAYFVAVNTVRFTARDIGKIGNLVDLAMQAGANEVNGISFDLSDPGAYEEDALEAAMAHARKKAGILAAAAGTEITGVHSIRESGSTRPSPVRMGFAADRAEAASVPVEPGEMTITGQVVVEYTHR